MAYFKLTVAFAVAITATSLSSFNAASNSVVDVDDHVVPAKRLPDCGEINGIFFGIPANHPITISEGVSPAAVDAALRGDVANIIAAGYNPRVILFGPEQPIDILESRMKDINWGVTGVGYGVRGSNLVNVTELFTDVVATFREKALIAPMVFDNSPNSMLWALQRGAPLTSNCTDHPGTSLGIETYCDICGNSTLA